MTYSRQFEHTDDDGDTLYVRHTTWTNEASGGDVTTTRDVTSPDAFVSIRTKGGRPVHLPLRVARELAGWLIEHAAEDPDAELTTPNQATILAAPPGVSIA
jgi:hypothetical protein